MVDLRKIINSTKLSFSLDKNLVKKFVDLVFENVDSNAKIIQKDIKSITGHTIKVNKINTAELGTVIFGCCFGLFTSNSSGMVTAKQGEKIEKISKEIIKEEFVESKYLIEKIDKYKSLYFKDNKFTYHPAGIFLHNFAEENIEVIFVENPQILNPILHKLVMSKLLLMMATPTRVFNKSYKKGSSKIEKELLNKTVNIKND